MSYQSCDLWSRAKPQVKKVGFCVLLLIFSNSALSDTCPNCDSEESYREEMALMIDLATDLKALDNLLIDVSPRSIAVLKEMVGDMDSKAPAQKALAIAIGSNEEKAEAKRHEQEMAVLVGAQELEVLRQQTAAAKAVQGSNSMSRGHQTPIAAPSQTTAPRKSKAVNIDKGLWVTFVEPGDDDTKKYIIARADGKVLTLGINDRFSFRSNRFQVVSIERASTRKDNRKYNVLALRNNESTPIKLDWYE